MIDLKNTTFIIPLKIDSVDRQNNLYTNLNYLNFHFKTNVIIYEQGRFIYENKIKMQEKFPNLNFKFLFNKDENEKIFHRTKYLNRMLDIVETPVVCNYDVDVIFNENVYKKCENLILSNQLDMIYPYGKGYFQIEVMKHANIKNFLEQPIIFNILKDQTNNPYNTPLILKYAEYGHAIFFKTSAYREAGGENENFISWGPEDQERYFRFNKLKYRQCWMSNNVYHFDHQRGIDSGHSNPYISVNDKLFATLKGMSDKEFCSYYKNQSYYKKYKTICFNQEYL